ncbi:MAG: methyltransferase [Ktedonobacteraceae bacterium]
MTSNTTNPESVFPAVVDDLVGLIKSQAIRLAAQLQLADLVKDGPKSLTELAEATGTNKAALYRLLYALANCGYFEEVEPEVFAQSELSYTLRTDIPRSLRDFAIMHGGEEWQWEPWRKALQSIQTGKAVFPEMFGKDLWNYFKNDNPEAGKRFQKAMSSQSRQIEQAIARGYDFSAARTIIDVGGGQGSLLATILQTYPTIHGTLFDQRPVVEMARQNNFVDGLQDRVTLVSGSFFEVVPSGADMYILKQIIHDWEDPECIQILSNCRKAMNADGRVLVIDEIITPGKKIPSVIALIDLQLQLLLTGRKRSEAEHRSLFEAAGLRLTQICPTDSTYTILEARAL